MPKQVWKFGKNWVGVKNKKKKMFATRKQASAYAGTKKRRSKTKTKSKQKRKRRSIRSRITRRRSSTMARRGRKYTRRKKAMSFAILPLIFMMWVLSKALQGFSLDQGLAGLGQPYENIKANWKELGTGLIIVTIASAVVRKFRIGFGIPGAIRARLA